MYGKRAVMTAPARQIDSHGPVSSHPIMRMVNFPNQRFYRFLLDIIIRLSMFPIVVISIRADAKSPKEPADAELCVLLFDKSISL